MKIKVSLMMIVASIVLGGAILAMAIFAAPLLSVYVPQSVRRIAAPSLSRRLRRPVQSRVTRHIPPVPRRRRH